MYFKNLSLVAISAVVVLSLVSTSCKKSNDNNNSAGVSATIGTTAFTPSTSTGFFYQGNGYFELAGYSIKGTDSTLLDVSIPGTFKLNTPMDAYHDDASVLYYAGGKEYIASYLFGTAKVTVTSYDSTNHKIGGTFTASLYNFTNANDSLILTNGKFNTSYTVTP